MDLIVNLLILLLVGYFLGYERQEAHKIIGIRSVTLVLLGSFIFTYISTQVGGDPARIIAQVVSATGFIGSALVFKQKADTISNLTTAILIWSLAAIGCMIGLGMILEVTFLSIVIYCILRYYKKLFDYGDR